MFILILQRARGGLRSIGPDMNPLLDGHRARVGNTGRYQARVKSVGRYGGTGDCTERRRAAADTGNSGGGGEEDESSENGWGSKMGQVGYSRKNGPNLHQVDQLGSCR
ncbi:hypothetical protein HAX54_036035 [Datura stramonium]|uniref:Uncharacterized protein n=1 Tax=Datura stramonium TaxID=4076 RepID=A0ABS8VHG5_DATST|nr:hypothetical protein [Datura stramonium]